MRAIGELLNIEIYGEKVRGKMCYGSSRRPSVVIMIPHLVSIYSHFIRYSDCNLTRDKDESIRWNRAPNY